VEIGSKVKESDREGRVDSQTGRVKGLGRGRSGGRAKVVDRSHIFQTLQLFPQMRCVVLCNIVPSVY